VEVRAIIFDAAYGVVVKENKSYRNGRLFQSI